MSTPPEEELTELEANLRLARQHRLAAEERQRETQTDIQGLLDRARALLRQAEEPSEGGQC